MASKGLWEQGTAVAMLTNGVDEMRLMYRVLHFKTDISGQHKQPFIQSGANISMENVQFSYSCP